MVDFADPDARDHLAAPSPEQWTRRGFYRMVVRDAHGGVLRCEPVEDRDYAEGFAPGYINFQDQYPDIAIVTVEQLVNPQPGVNGLEEELGRVFKAVSEGGELPQLEHNEAFQVVDYHERTPNGHVYEDWTLPNTPTVKFPRRPPATPQPQRGGLE